MINKLPVKCKHNRSLFCKECSAYRMVFLLKNGNDHLKEKAPNGNLYNPVRYNFVNKNRKGIKYNVNGMIRRFQNHPIFHSSNVIIFYDNNTGKEIAEVRP